jgi:ubiquinone/menaquinone biosynthesis C-methylase UbiE
MLALARARAAELGVEVDLRLGDAQALEFEDARFETVLITLPSERVRARSDRPSADESTSQRALA